MLDDLLEKLFGSRRKYLLPTGSSSAARSRVQAPHVRSGIRRVFGMKPGADHSAESVRTISNVLGRLGRTRMLSAGLAPISGGNSGRVLRAR